MSVLKRFIAGARCPACGAEDRVRVWRQDEREYRECVNCSYQDVQDLSATPATQPAPGGPEKHQDSVQVVRFVSSTEKGDSH